MVRNLRCSIDNTNILEVSPLSSDETVGYSVSLDIRAILLNQRAFAKLSLSHAKAPSCALFAKLIPAVYRIDLRLTWDIFTEDKSHLCHIPLIQF